MKFYMDNKTLEYIRHKGGLVTLVLELEPSGGGCCCATSAKNITGSYIPQILLGSPQEEDKKRFIVTQIHDVTIHYQESLALKQGYDRIEICLKSALLWQWLEIKGAKGKALY